MCCIFNLVDQFKLLASDQQLFISTRTLTCRPKRMNGVHRELGKNDS